MATKLVNVKFTPGGTMTRKEFMKSIRGSFNEGYELIKAKNHDYARGNDPFKNFRLSEVVLGIPVEKGILLRILDKISRIGNLLDSQAKVKEESIDQNLIDIQNYSAIIRAWRQGR